MKKFILLSILCISSLLAKGQMDLPGIGGNLRAMVSEDIGITTVTIKYSRPAVKGREGKIWGGVVANGFNTYNMITGRMSSIDARGETVCNQAMMPQMKTVINANIEKLKQQKDINQLP